MGDEDKSVSFVWSSVIKNESYRVLTKTSAKLNMGVHVPVCKGVTDVYVVFSTGVRLLLPRKEG